ncbi:MAG: nucleoside deaminase [Nitrospirae bacterium]|nr:nucleoside deaminase [Nitrospirota bacterium]
MTDREFMELAIAEARAALPAGDVPVGALVVVGGEVVALAHNRREADNDPTAHAEVLAIREAAGRLGRWRLDDATVYITKEPCVMCAGALMSARVKRVVYGAHDPKFGAAWSVFNILDDDRLNHRAEVSAGVMTEECLALLREFFEGRRG